MINLRYHIVSITAVFLALGIGVALGGTFLDRYTVDLLEGNIDRAETRIRETEARNRELNRDLTAAQARDSSLTAVGSRFLLADRLADVPVLLITQPGTDDASRDAVLQALSRSGADLHGTIVLEEGLLLDQPNADIAAAVSEDREDTEAVADAVNGAFRLALYEAGRPSEGEPAPAGDDGAEPSTTATTQGVDGATNGDPGDGDAAPDGDIATTEDPSDGGVVPDPVQPAIIGALLDSGLIRYEPAAGYDTTNPLLATGGFRYVFLGDDTPNEAANTILLRLLDSGSGVLPAAVVAPTVGAEPGAGHEKTVVSQIISDDALARRYSTVDNVDTFNGLVATVIIIRDIEGGEIGHYGQAAGATALLPGAS